MGGIATKEVQDDLWSQDALGKDKRGSTKQATQSRSRSPSLRGKQTEYANSGPTDFFGDPDSDDTTNDVRLGGPENYDPKTAGPIFPNGEINFDCPCLGESPHGPCGTEFRQTLLCVQYYNNTEEEKERECLPKFMKMHDCFSQYPEYHHRPKEHYDEDEDENNEEDVYFAQDELQLINDYNDEMPEETKADNPQEENETLPSSPPA